MGFYQQRNIEEHGHPYKISVVMAVYNVEQYIEEAIDSLLEQTINFEKNVQIILVDDGSPDNSGQICDEYEKRYPNNIVVLHKENGGAASARNEGLKHVTGRYVNFMDPDDKMSKDTFNKVYNFFIKHEESIDVVSIPLFFFEGSHGEHPLNYKFKKGTRIIDLKWDHDAIQMSLSAAFFTLRSLEGKLMDSLLPHAEDAKFLFEVLIDKQKLGIVSDCRYNYRKRVGGETSLIQGAVAKKENYTVYLERFSVWVYNYCYANLGYIPHYVQAMIMYDVSWKVKLPDFPEGLLSCDEKDEFFRLLHEILVHTDDEIIKNVKHTYIDHKSFMFYLKYEHHGKVVQQEDGKFALMYGLTNLTYLENHACQIDFINISKSAIQIEGYIAVLGGIETENVFLQVNDVLFPTDFIDRKNHEFALGNIAVFRRGFNCEIPLDNITQNDNGSIEIQIFHQIADGIIVKKENLRFGIFAPVSRSLKCSYFYKDSWKLTVTNCSLNLEKCGFWGHVKSECRLLNELWKIKKPGSRRAVASRLLCRMAKPFNQQNTWLISDRMTKADDNGEALFRYVNEQKLKRKPKTYFAINNDTSDANRIKKYGKTIDLGGWAYKFRILLGATVVSSHADQIYIDPFPGSREFYADILHDSKTVFLQHGVTLHDVSGWLHKYWKNFNLFITTSEKEYYSILNGAYFYGEDVVKLLGFPRYDLLTTNPKKYITIMPTWRKDLCTALNPIDNIWEMKSNFENSEYFLFYNELLNNSQLLDISRKLGYTIRFMIHPSMQASIDYFEKRDDVVFLDIHSSYRDIFSESDLIVTDYSSIAFDFAYLRKPLIYSQFDRDSFYSGTHLYTGGYFDFERDGFGEVEVTLDDTVNRIIEYMENGCQLKDKYLKRIESTFTFNDKNNCQRVYEAILQMSNK